MFALQKAGIEVVDGQQLMQRARVIKTQDEIVLLDTACMMVDAAYEELYREMRPGMRENECVGLVSKVLYDLGSEHVEGVNAISGERANPHPHVYSDRVLRPGDPAYFDILHSHMGYRTCYYRTFAVGSASRSQVDAYRRCRDMLDRAIAVVRPGATTAEVASVWPTAQEFGFANEEAAFALQFGHGVGLSIWEKPIISRLVSLDHPEPIEEGMVFALETFWPASDGWSAARIEEQLVVTATGCEVITRFPAENLMVAGRYHYHTVDGPLPGIRETQSNLNRQGGDSAGLGAAVEARTTRVGSNSRVCGVAAGSSIRSSSSSAARAPIRACGIRTVVSGGANRSANGMSLKPITDTSSGQRSPSSASAVYAPSASRSLPATIAVGRGSAPSSRRADVTPSDSV